MRPGRGLDVAELLHVLPLPCPSPFNGKELLEFKSLHQPIVCELSLARPVGDLDDRKLVVCLA